MSTIKNQHLVTQAYLKRWADEKEQVHVFDIQCGKSYRANIRNVASQTYFYSPPDGDQVVEQWISHQEGPWMELQEELLERSSTRRKRKGHLERKLMYRSDKELLVKAVVFQAVRVERVRRNLGIPDPDAARDAHVQVMLHPGAQSLMAMLMSWTWVIGINDLGRTGHVLYTSDHPVCPVPENPDVPDDELRFGGMHFPLSPTRILAIYKPEASPFSRKYEGRAVELGQNDVLLYNTIQATSAHRVLISSTNDFRVARTIQAKRRVEGLDGDERTSGGTSRSTPEGPQQSQRQGEPNC
jgi:hypothetical protein